MPMRPAMMRENPKLNMPLSVRGEPCGGHVPGGFCGEGRTGPGVSPTGRASPVSGTPLSPTPPPLCCRSSRTYGGAPVKKRGYVKRRGARSGEYPAGRRNATKRCAASGFYASKRAMAANSSACRDAPPTSTPSTSSLPMMEGAEEDLTEPP